MADRESGFDHVIKCQDSAFAPARDWIIVRNDARTLVEAWTHFRLPFEPTADQRAFRAELRQQLACLSAPDPGFLIAEYVSASLPPGCDVENVLFYNVGMSAFAHLAGKGISFAVKHSAIPRAPAGRSYEHYVRYAVADGCVETSVPPKAEPISTLTRIPLTLKRGQNKPWTVWRDIQRHLDHIDEIHAPLEIRGRFAVDVRLMAPPSEKPRIASLLKPLLDGVVSSFHHGVTLTNDELSLLSRQIGEDSETIHRWWTRAGPVKLSSKSPMQFHGDSVWWHPADSCLTQGSVALVESRNDHVTMTLAVRPLD